MKKIMLISLCMLLIATSAFALIAGSKHDLTAAAYYTGAQVSSCQFCHAPHHAVAGPPLWNRATSVASYTLYGSGSTLAGTTVNAPGSNSQTCLSCHDGSIAVGDIVNGTDSVIQGVAPLNTDFNAAGRLVAGNAFIGTDLRTSHPIGVNYVTGNIAGLNTATVASGSNWTVNGKAWLLYTSNKRVECGSCHDPHSTTNTPFLKDTKTTMCADCHSLK